MNSYYQPPKLKIRYHNLYCEAQGPKVPLGEDHVTSPMIQNFEEVGEPDEFGGRQLVVSAGGVTEVLQQPVGAYIVCNKCGARLRRYELRDEGKPS